MAVIIQSERLLAEIRIGLDRIIHVFPLDCPIKSGNDGKIGRDVTPLIYTWA
jgi:hypothetical protein